MRKPITPIRRQPAMPGTYGAASPVKMLDPAAKIVFGSFPQKPKWMRWATYRRLQERHDALRAQYESGWLVHARRIIGEVEESPRLSPHPISA